MWRRFWKAEEATRKPVWTLSQVARLENWGQEEQQRWRGGKAGVTNQGGLPGLGAVAAGSVMSKLERWRNRIGKESQECPHEGAQVLTLLPSTPIAK